MTTAPLIAIGLSNALAAAILALVAFAASRLARNAPVAHFLWALVILKLLTPPLFEVHVPFGAGVLGPRPDAAAPPAGAGRMADGAIPDVEPREHEPATDAGFDPPRVLLVEDPPAPGAAAPSAPPAIAPPPPVAAAPRDAAAGVPWSAGGLLAAAWLSGSLSWYALALCRLIRFRRLLARARPAHEGLVEEVRLVALGLGLEQAPEVVVLAARVSPLVWAFGGRARLVIPEELATSLTASQRKTLIAHEIAHLIRRDHWLRWVELLALGLYWWLPIAWWARRELRAAEEECCDAWVQWAFPGERREYARTLLRTVDFLSRGPAAVPEGASGMAQVSNLERRFRMILHGRSARRLPGPCRAALVVFAALVLPWVVGFGAEDATEDGGNPTLGEAPASSPPLKEIRILLERDEKSGATLRRLGKGPPSTVEELAAAIEKAKAGDPKMGEKGFKVVIEASSDVPWEDVVQVLDLSKKLGAGIELATPPPGGSGVPRASTTRDIFLKSGKQQVLLEDNALTLVDSTSKKVLWKTALEGKSKILGIQEDKRGNLLLALKPGKTIVLDLETGKVVKEAGVEPAEKPPAGKWEASGTASGAGLGIPGASAGSPIDVVQLGSALIEARGAVQLAKSKLQAMSGTEGVVSQGELMAEKIQIETAERKIDLLRRIAKSALKGAVAETEALRKIEDMARKRYEAGQAGEDAILGVTLRRVHVETLVSLIEQLLDD